MPQYHWQQITLAAPFAPRDGAGALTFNGRMWFLGGWNPDDPRNFPRICNNEVWSSVDGQTWVLEKPNTFLATAFDATADWEGRHTGGYVVHDGKMWLIGGDANQGHYQSDVWNSTDGRRWTHVNPGHPVPWGPRVMHYSVAFQGKIWVIGGQTLPQKAAADELFFNDVWTSTDGIAWARVLEHAPWPPRGMIGGAAVMNGRIWLLGGGTYSTPKVPVRKFYNDVWSTADGVQWQCHTPAAPWPRRQYHDVGVFDGRLWVLEGGWDQQNHNDVWHSADGVHWEELPGTPWKPRHAASVFVHDDALWMVAGNNMESDVWKLVRG